MIIAIDFDDTITEYSPYPITGKIREDAIYYIDKLYKDGHTLILWTCRYGSYLNEALDLLKQANILHCFKYINEDGSNKSRKVEADYYIDDRNILIELDWEKLYNHIVINRKEKE